MNRATTSSWPKDNILVQVLQKKSCFPFGAHYPCQCVLFLVYLGFYVVFISFHFHFTVQVISQWAVGRAEETSTYSWSRFCKLPTNSK